MYGESGQSLDPTDRGDRLEISPGFLSEQGENERDLDELHNEVPSDEPLVDAVPTEQPSHTNHRPREESQGDDDSQEQCAVCNTGEEGFMICCDECDLWYHGKCVEVTREQSSLWQEYYCFTCADSNVPTEGYGIKRPKSPSARDQDRKARRERREHLARFSPPRESLPDEESSPSQPNLLMSQDSQYSSHEQRDDSDLQQQLMTQRHQQQQEQLLRQQQQQQQQQRQRQPQQRHPRDRQPQQQQQPQQQPQQQDHQQQQEQHQRQQQQLQQQQRQMQLSSLLQGQSFDPSDPQHQLMQMRLKGMLDVNNFQREVEVQRSKQQSLHQRQIEALRNAQARDLQKLQNLHHDITNENQRRELRELIQRTRSTHDEHLGALQSAQTYERQQLEVHFMGLAAVFRQHRQQQQQREDNRSPTAASTADSSRPNSAGSTRAESPSSQSSSSREQTSSRSREQEEFIRAEVQKRQLLAQQQSDYLHQHQLQMYAMQQRAQMEARLRSGDPAQVELAEKYLQQLQQYQERTGRSFPRQMPPSRQPRPAEAVDGGSDGQGGSSSPGAAAAARRTSRSGAALEQFSSALASRRRFQQSDNQQQPLTTQEQYESSIARQRAQELLKAFGESSLASADDKAGGGSDAAAEHATSLNQSAASESSSSRGGGAWNYDAARKSSGQSDAAEQQSLASKSRSSTENRKDSSESSASSSDQDQKKKRLIRQLEKESQNYAEETIQTLRRRAVLLHKTFVKVAELIAMIPEQFYTYPKLKNILDSLETYKKHLHGVYAIPLNDSIDGKTTEKEREQIVLERSKVQIDVCKKIEENLNRITPEIQMELSVLHQQMLATYEYQQSVARKENSSSNSTDINDQIRRQQQNQMASNFQSNTDLSSSTSSQQQQQIQRQQQQQQLQLQLQLQQQQQQEQQRSSSSSSFLQNDPENDRKGIDQGSTEDQQSSSGDQQDVKRPKTQRISPTVKSSNPTARNSSQKRKRSNSIQSPAVFDGSELPKSEGSDEQSISLKRSRITSAGASASSSSPTSSPTSGSTSSNRDSRSGKTDPDEDLSLPSSPESPTALKSPSPQIGSSAPILSDSKSDFTDATMNSGNDAVKSGQPITTSESGSFEE